MRFGVRPRVVPTYPPGPRRLAMYYVTQKGDLLWTNITGSPRQIDRSVIEATARAHGMGGAYRVQPNAQLVVPR